MFERNVLNSYWSQSPIAPTIGLAALIPNFLADVYVLMKINRVNMNFMLFYKINFNQKNTSFFFYFNNKNWKLIMLK